MSLIIKKDKKLDFGKVFNAAVAGYRATNKQEEQKTPAQTCVNSTGQTIQLVQAQTKPEQKPIEGVSMTELIKFTPKQEELMDLSKFSLSYPLIPKDSLTPFARAEIRWSTPDQNLVYYLIEPKLTEEEKNLLASIKQTLIEKLDIDFGMLRKDEAKEYIIAKFKEMLGLMAKNLPAERQNFMLYYIERDFIGLEKIEPIMKDPNIEDISCDGIGTPLYIYHRNPLIGSIPTNVVYNSGEELDKFINKLSQRCGKTVSIANPLLGAALPDGSRIQATLGTDIARKGSNFTIRKFTEEPLTPVDLINYRTISSKLAAYLWMMVEHGRSILISGGVASGKTSALNALSLFIKPSLRVVSIEDTPELKLPHQHWISQVARQPISEIGGKKMGEVDLFDLLRESLRQRPDYLIVGEVRGRETYVLFQQIATGHASMSTIHADSMERLVDRLTTPPISLPANLIESLDVIIFLVRVKYGNKYIRKVSSVYEILGFDREKQMPIVNKVFKWNPINDKIEPSGDSVALKKISESYGIPTAILQKEISQREKVLDWMVEKKITNFKDVARIIKIYYSRPNELLNII